MKKNFGLKNNRNAKNLNNMSKFCVKIKCLIGRKTILLQFFAAFSNKILSLKCIFTYLL